MDNRQEHVNQLLEELDPEQTVASTDVVCDGSR